MQHWPVAINLVEFRKIYGQVARVCNPCMSCHRTIGHDEAICQVSGITDSHANYVNESLASSTLLDESIELSLGIASMNTSMAEPNDCESVMAQRYGMAHSDVVALADALCASYGLDFSSVHAHDPTTELDRHMITQYDHLIAVGMRYGDDILSGDDPLLAAPTILEKHYNEYKGFLPQQISTVYSITAVIAQADNHILDELPADAPDTALTEKQLAALSRAESTGDAIAEYRRLTHEYLESHYKSDAPSQSTQSTAQMVSSIQHD